MKSLWLIVSRYWRIAAVGLVVFSSVVGLLFYQIGSIPKGASEGEVLISTQHDSFRSIAEQPTNAPYYIVRNIARKISRPNIIQSRLISAGIAVLVISAFYILISYWFKQKVALLGLALFVVSDWFLRVGRLGKPEILQCLVILVALISVWLQRAKNQNLVLIIGSIVAALLLYIPGMIWFLGFAFIWQGKRVLFDSKKATPVMLIASYFLFLLLVTPLLASLIKSPKILLEISGLPSTMILPQVFIKNVARTVLSIFIRSYQTTGLTISTLPILNVFEGVLVLVGVYTSIKNWALDRNKLIIGIFVVGVLLYSLSGQVTIAILLPAIYLLASSGIAYLLDEWFKVFPRNPLAGRLGTLMFSVAVMFSCIYHISYYYVAWPNATSTKANFSQRL